MMSIMADVQYLAKDDRVEFGNTKYKALSEEKVTSIMRAELLKHKLVVFPIDQTAIRSGSITHVDVRYRMVNVENPEEFIEIVSCGDGADTQDKGSGKAMTYAFKYMWLRTFALPTGDILCVLGGSSGWLIFSMDFYSVASLPMVAYSVFFQNLMCYTGWEGR
jgi:hypothetical protein